MMKNKIWLILVLGSLLSCKNENCFDKIVLSFGDVNLISEDSFIIFDDNKLTHSEDFQKIQFSNTLLPSSYVRMFGSVENPIGQKVTSTTIITKLADNLRATGIYLIKEQVNSSKEVELIISRKDMGCMTLSYSENYPIELTFRTKN